MHETVMQMQTIPLQPDRYRRKGKQMTPITIGEKLTRELDVIRTMAAIREVTNRLKSKAVNGEELDDRTIRVNLNIIKGYINELEHKVGIGR